MRRVAAMAILFACVGDCAAQSAAQERFARLAALAGTWETRAERPLRIEYRLISAGTALVETWRTASGRETMTVYHIDGDAVVADHYCAQGNVPRLALAGADGARFDFRFRDGANVRVPGASHQHSFWLDTATPGVLRIGGVYVGNEATPDQIAGAVPDPTLELVRTASGSPRSAAPAPRTNP